MSRTASSRRTSGRAVRRTPIVLLVLAASVAGISSSTLGRALRDDGSPSGEANGALPDGVSAFADTYPGVTRLDDDLLGALRRATVDAAREGVELVVTSGWRSPAYQRALFLQAVSEHGSAEEAARWVATEDTSAHVTGDAVDVGPSEATAWLSQHGPAYGLCPIYDNEPWHYELRAEAIDRGCPRPYADPTHDPRMQPQITRDAEG